MGFVMVVKAETVRSIAGRLTSTPANLQTDEKIRVYLTREQAPEANTGAYGKPALSVGDSPVSRSARKSSQLPRPSPACFPH